VSACFFAATHLVCTTPFETFCPPCLHKPCEKFSPAFFKRRRSGGRGALLALRRARNFFDRRFSFCQAFSFAPFSPKEKAVLNDSCCVTTFVSWIKVLIKLFKRFVRKTFVTAALSATFFFDHTGAKKKVIKKETPGLVSLSAESEEGCAPSTSQTFEKV